MRPYKDQFTPSLMSLIEMIEWMNMYPIEVAELQRKLV
jgi:hypothetical protein